MAQHTSVWLIRAYQRVLSPLLAGLAGPLGRCRYEPSCSQYASEAIQIHGAVKGIGLATWRICRCAPWGGCGHDPVPPIILKVQNSKFQVPESRVPGAFCKESEAAPAISGGRS